VLCNVRTPRMNAIIDRWTGGCRRELLDRPLTASATFDAHVWHVGIAHVPVLARDQEPG